MQNVTGAKGACGMFDGHRSPAVVAAVRALVETAGGFQPAYDALMAYYLDQKDRAAAGLPAKSPPTRQ